MTLAQLVPIALQVSVALVVFAVGLRTRHGDLSYLLHNPSMLLRSLLAMNVVMPVLAVATALLFHLRPEVEVALILLAVAPVPPILPGKQQKAGGNVSYAIGLLTLAAVVAILTVPASIAIIGRFFEREIHVPVAVVAKIMLITVLGPMILGALLQRVAPTLAERLAKPLSIIGTVLLVLGIVPMFAAAWPAITRQVGEFTLIAIALFALAGLVVGHLLGGPAPEDRTVLALSTATRHPGIALALSGIVAPGNAGLAASVLLATLVVAVITVPYVKWRKRGQAALAATAVPDRA